jgi:branched-chain amino acid transport system ATP-binding protein
LAASTVLESEDLTIRFGGHAAVDAVSCRFEPGTLTAIVGPNGAGKTTYFNLLSGQLRATAGRVRFGERDITRLPPSARAKLGLGRAFQLTQLFPRLSVRENVRLAVQARQGIGLVFGSIWSDHRSLIDRADAIVERIALGARRDTAAALLPHGDQRKLEVAMLMALDPSVYLFDEPTAGMSGDEAPVILSLIESIKADRTRTVILVEHKLDVVRSLSDRIIVLHQGRKVADGDPVEVMGSALVRDAYLGQAP